MRKHLLWIILLSAFVCLPEDGAYAQDFAYYSASTHCKSTLTTGDPNIQTLGYIIRNNHTSSSKYIYCPIIREDDAGTGYENVRVWFEDRNGSLNLYCWAYVMPSDGAYQVSLSISSGTGNGGAAFKGKDDQSTGGLSTSYSNPTYYMMCYLPYKTSSGWSGIFGYEVEELP